MSAPRAKGDGGAPPAHCAVLLRALIDPLCVARLGPGEWDLLIRVSRRARLHGTLHARLAACHALDRVPDRALAHLESGAAVARYRLQLVRWEQHHLAQVLAPLGVPLVLLKGAAYAAQALPLADGRSLNDVDVMVPAGAIARVEHVLREAGWRGEVGDPYDDRYYREWSHEIPPLVGPGRSVEVDLHHTILPPTGRLRPDAARLFAEARPVSEAPFRVLAPADQVLHAVVHLLQDTDSAERLRDLVDLDGLLRAFGTQAGFWASLAAHTAHHGLQRPLWYALDLARRWLDAPVDAHFLRDLHAPPVPLSALMRRLHGATLFPVHPDVGRTAQARLAWELLRLRALWMRMPATLLLRHAAHKLLRALRGRDQAPLKA